MSHDERDGKTTEGMRNVKNLDYKNASSETVTNSRTFTNPANYTYFHGRARALSKFLRHLGNDSSLWRDFRQDESRAKCYAIILVTRWDFREVFRPITEFVRASKFHILANKVTRRVSQRDFDFNDPLINSKRFFSQRKYHAKKKSIISHTFFLSSHLTSILINYKKNHVSFLKFISGHAIIFYII